MRRARIAAQETALSLTPAHFTRRAETKEVALGHLAHSCHASPRLASYRNWWSYTSGGVTGQKARPASAVRPIAACHYRHYASYASSQRLFASLGSAERLRHIMGRRNQRLRLSRRLRHVAPELSQAMPRRVAADPSTNWQVSRQLTHCKRAAQQPESSQDRTQPLAIRGASIILVLHRAAIKGLMQRSRRATHRQAELVWSQSNRREG